MISLASIDGLKTINDTFGHDAGDEAIKITASLLHYNLPKNSLLGRLGGDEFVAFVFLNFPSEISETGKAIQRKIDEYNTTHSNVYDLSISYGGAFFTISKGSPMKITQIMIEADEHLYEMKRKKKSSRRCQNV